MCTGAEWAGPIGLAGCILAAGHLSNVAGLGSLGQQGCWGGGWSGSGQMPGKERCLKGLGGCAVRAERRGLAIGSVPCGWCCAADVKLTGAGAEYAARWAGTGSCKCAGKTREMVGSCASQRGYVADSLELFRCASAV